MWNRDALVDWNTQSANTLRVFRLDPPDREPMSDDELAERAASEAVGRKAQLARRHEGFERRFYTA